MRCWFFSQRQSHIFCMRAVSSLCCGVVELVLPGAAEASLNSSVFPQPLDDPGEFSCHETLVRWPCQHEQLTCIILPKQSPVYWSHNPQFGRNMGPFTVILENVESLQMANLYSAFNVKINTGLEALLSVLYQLKGTLDLVWCVTIFQKTTILQWTNMPFGKKCK